MTLLQTISILLFIASLSAFLNYHFLRLPPAIGIMIISLCASLLMIFLSHLGIFDLTSSATLIRNFDFSSLLLHGMLAFLLFAGALQVDLGEMSPEKGTIAVLSTFGVLLATILTGVLFWCGAKIIGIEVPFVIAMVFGAIISPTDPIAALGILKQAGVSKSLQITISGESLFNDGIGVVVFLAISALAFDGEVSTGSLVLTLIREIIGGAGLGFILGFIAYRMLRSVDAYPVEVLLTLALAGGSYSLAELIHVSAPICTVVAGLIVGNQGRAFAMSATTKEHLDTFWEMIDEFLNAVLFMLIGLEIIALTINLKWIGMGLLAIVAVLIGRLVSVWIPIALLKKKRDFSPGVVKILTWGGLRGGISVALALSLPLFEQHDLLVVVTYITVLFSILIQGSSLKLMTSKA